MSGAYGCERDYRAQVDPDDDVRPSNPVCKALVHYWIAVSDVLHRFAARSAPLAPLSSPTEHGLKSLARACVSTFTVTEAAKGGRFR